jgi:hypothetical protein
VIEKGGVGRDTRREEKGKFMMFMMVDAAGKRGRRRLIAPVMIVASPPLDGIGKGTCFLCLFFFTYLEDTHFTCVSYARRCTLISYEWVWLGSVIKRLD